MNMRYHGAGSGLGTLIVVSDGQFGSAGKGHVTEMLSSPEIQGGRQVIGVRVGGHNAGHIVHGLCPIVDEDPGRPVAEGEICHGGEPYEEHVQRNALLEDGTRGTRWIGHPWRLRTVPVQAVTNSKAQLVIAQGSEVDTRVLWREVNALESAGYEVRSRLMVDAKATLLTQAHIDQEVQAGMNDRLGSTAKGVGAARADRIWRTAELYGDVHPQYAFNTVPYLYHQMSMGAAVIIEGVQGFGLSQYGGFYPQCTSSGTTAIDFLSMAGLSPWHESVGDFQSWLVARVRPIRVAGNSGPLKGETTWAELGLKEEKTTVTQKTRRVGDWDGDLVRRAIQANGGRAVKLAITMFDHLIPELAGMNTTMDLGKFSHLADAAYERYAAEQSRIEDDLGKPISWIGTGPTTGLWLR